MDDPEMTKPMADGYEEPRPLDDDPAVHLSADERAWKARLERRIRRSLTDDEVAELNRFVIVGDRGTLEFFRDKTALEELLDEESEGIEQILDLELMKVMDFTTKVTAFYTGETL